MASTNDLTNQFTLINVVKKMDPNITRFVNLYAQNNQFIYDIPWYPTSHDISHMFELTTKLGASFVKRYNKGVGNIKHDYGRVTEYTMSRQVYATVEVKQNEDFDLNREKQRQSTLTIEAMGQETAQDLLYGNRAVDPDKVDGLITRRSAVSTSNEGRFQTCRRVGTIAASTGGTYYDVLIVEPGEGKFYFTYPKRSQFGITMRDLGESTDKDADGAMLQVERTLFGTDYGICIEDPRAVQRIANIVPGAVLASPNAANAWDPKVFNEAISFLPSRGKGAIIYAPREIWLDMLNNQINTPGVIHQDTDPWGRPQFTYLGIPVVIIDAFLPYTAAI